MAETLQTSRASFRAAGRLIVDGVDVTAPPGAVTGVLGPNGSGKTTLLRLVVGVLPLETGAVLLDGVDLARVTVVYPGVGPRFRPLAPEQTEPVRRKLALPEQFILFVSTLEPRKNVARLIEAFARLGAEGFGLGPGESGHVPSATSQAPELQLVLAGRRGWLYDDIFATIARLNLGDRVRVLDFVDDNDLPALYNLACVFAYPSIYEGFGLPVLEALACGTPVVTADNSSLPEVVGDAAVLVDADDVASIASGLTRAMADEPLRARLRADGPQRAQRFSWAQAAKQVLDCYRALGATRGTPSV